MVIEYIKIQNFQKFKKYKIILEPGVNVICGESDSGKSAIIRSFIWCATNKPSGESFRRHQSNYTRVCIKADAKRIYRSRGKENTYRLDNDTFRSFGGNVPSDIEAIININSVNVQRQHDPPFWFSLSPGEVSRELNSIINLGLIDSTLSNLASELRKAKSIVEVTTTRLKEARSKRDSLKWVKEAWKEHQKLECLEADYLQKSENTEILTSIIEQASRLDLDVESVGKAKVDAVKLIALADTLRDYTLLQTNLVNILTELEQTWQTLTVNQTELSESEKLLSQQKSCPLCGAKMS